ncbi:MAG: hypothetical protein MUF71_00205 [Candidatus Kapabacteria bacterium]|jgi:hypothetical protein|nr:hypothetical protein [Candidatus Kapabacteria bacterium]
MSKALPNHTIFVEGPEDSQFLRELMREWYHMKVTRPEAEKKTAEQEKSGKAGAGEFTDFMHCGGKTQFEKNAPAFQDSTLQGLTNIVFLDADSLQKDETVGGLDKTIELCLSLQVKHNITVSKAFIFPNTILDVENKTVIKRGDETGDLETILHHIAVERRLLECWEKYEECVRNNAHEEEKKYQPPGTKTKFYAYSEAVLRNADNAGGARRQYRNDFWNLDPNQLYLQRLRTFLDEIVLPSSE